MSIYKILIEHGVKIYVGSSPSPFDLDNPLDNLNMNMLSLISQYDNQLRSMISVRWKRNSLPNGKTIGVGTKPFGYDVKNKKYGDMYAMGIIDPAKVTKNALRNAVSVATTILSTNAIVTMKRN